MKKILFHLFFSLTITTLYGQKDSVSSIKRWNAGLSLGIVPIPPSAISIQPNIEFFISPKFSLLNEISLQLEKNDHADSAALNKKFFKYKAEFRYYFRRLKKGGLYAALQFATAKREFISGKPSYYYDAAYRDSIYSYDKAKVNSPFTTITAQFGGAFKLYGELHIDISLGSGYRIINTSYSETINLRKESEDFRWILLRPMGSYRYAGMLTRPQLNFWTRLYYRF